MTERILKRRINVIEYNVVAKLQIIDNKDMFQKSMKGLLVHTLNSKIFTLEATTPQIFRSKKLSGMIRKVSKLTQKSK